MAAFGAGAALRTALVLLACADSWANRINVELEEAAREHLPLCAQQIVDETCQTGHSALELVAEAARSSQEAALPLLKSLGLSHDAPCRAVCGAVVKAIPAGSLPRSSDKGCRFDFDASSVACDVSFLAVDSEVLPAQEQPATALAEMTAEELPPHRPVRAGRRARAGTRPRMPALSRSEILVEIANRFRIYPYRFSEAAANASLLEAHPQVFAPGYASHAGFAGGRPGYVSHVGGFAGNAGYPGYAGAHMPQPQVHQPQVHQPQVHQPQVHQQQVHQPPVMPQPVVPQPGTPLYHHVHQHPGSASSVHHHPHGGSAPAHSVEGVLCTNCEGNQLRKIEESRVVALKMLVSTLQAMRQGKPSVAGNMKTYFGKDSEVGRRKILDMLDQVNVMVNGKLLYDVNGEECDAGTIAYVYAEEMTEDETMHIIHLCAAFFQGMDMGNLQGFTSDGRKSVRAYTVIHELTHHLGTDDVCSTGSDEPCGRMGKAYGGALVRALARFNPERALNNADSVALFAQAFTGTFW